MDADLLAAVDAFDRVVAAADGLVDPQVLDPVAETVRATRDRVGYLGDTVVAAVAGGTGSGKSSLINALAEEVVSESGGMRPTTGEPVAWIPSNPEPGLVRLLDDLGVTERVGQDRHDWLALIDLPDTDSVVVDHRHRVEELLPRVDLVLWMIDPEKYQDAVLHDRYLRPLAGYQRQFVFVLNQIDRLEGVEVDEVVADLVSTLNAEGFTQPIVLAVAADPDMGPPIGVDELVDHLEHTVDVKRVVYEKLATDLGEAARTLATSPELSGAVGFESRWETARRDAAETIAAGDRREGSARLEAFVDQLAVDAGGSTALTLRDEVGPDVVRSAVDVAFESSGAFRPVEPVAAPSWASGARWAAIAVALVGLVWGIVALAGDGGLLWPIVVVVVAVASWVWLGSWISGYRTRATRRATEEHRRALVEPVADRLDAQLGRPLRSVLRRRAAASAAATELELALADLERRLGW